MTARQESADRARAVVETWLQDSGVAWEAGVRAGEYAVTLPGEAKLRTTVSVVVRDHTLAAVAFVVRRPDENHEAVYRWCLAKNLRLPGIAFAVDSVGDVYLTGRLPVSAVTADTLDALFGALLATADSAFNDLLALGFLESMKREWAWRTSRGESLANLEAFRDLLDPQP